MLKIFRNGFHFGARRCFNVSAISNADQKLQDEIGNEVNPELVKEDDFFGFNDVGTVDTSLKNYDRDEVLKKYDYLFNKNVQKHEEQVYHATFGIIRYDADNAPRKSKSRKNNLIEQQYFGNYDQETETQVQEFVESDNVENNYIEEQYFNSKDSNSNSLFQSPDVLVANSMEPNDETLTGNYIEDTFFGQANQNERPVVDPKNYFEEAATAGTQNSTTKLKISPENPKTRLVKSKKLSSEPQPSSSSSISTSKSQDSFGQMSVRKPTPAVVAQPQETSKQQVKKPMTAYDYAVKKRREIENTNPNKNEDDDDDTKTTSFKRNMAEKFDSKGFRILNQVTNLQELPEMMVLQMLKHNVLYNENDIVAICKPYGLPVQPGAGHRHYLTKFLPELVKFVSNDESCTELYTVHRLDKETTGVLLLAKTQKMADILSNMFAEGKINKTYWAVTKSVPAPLQGVVDIPMYEILSDGKSRMMLKVDYDEDTRNLIKKSSKKSKRAVTEYKVLSQFGNAALVELKPLTGVKHQIRVHLASGLCCPVLGDHKYSHFIQLAPQKLPSDLLQRFNIRQSKVRHLPMHLHARAVAIPEIVDGRNIVVGAKLPQHFASNLKRLKIEWPQQ